MDAKEHHIVVERKKPMEYPFIIDAFTERRGKPAMLEISCSSCKGYLLTYQKDGPGPLLRCYWDRIYAPEKMHNLQQAKESAPPIFHCPSCGQEIGKKGVYEKEERMAFFLVENSVEIKELNS